MADMIPISSPRFGPDVEALVLEVLRSGRIAQGPMVERFESQCADMAGTTHAIAMSNGTVTLEAALAILGVGPGDEVITSPFTFAATFNAILSAGATARFADITDDFTVDPASVEALINERTKAIVPVHLYGLCADMTALASMASSRGIAIVEDAAQAHGATVGDRRAGSWGLGSFSFYATKNIAAGEGGCITTSDDELAQSLRIYRNQGMRARYDYSMVGHNLRMTDLHAAVAIPQMGRLDEINAARQANAKALTAGLSANAAIATPEVPDGRTHVWHQYTILVPAERRDAIVAELNNRGVNAGVYYPGLVWDYHAYQVHPHVARDNTPNAARLAGACLSLPVHQHLTDSQIDRVITTTLDVVGN
jgi:dTDP-4-amino-4,6-dideoxygalactose transaminase